MSGRRVRHLKVMWALRFGEAPSRGETRRLRKNLMRRRQGVEGIPYARARGMEVNKWAGR